MADIQAIEKNVLAMLNKNLPALLTYHNTEHTLDVTNQCMRIAAEEGITDKQQLEELHIAALYHDTGFVSTYRGHEEAGCKLAREQLPAFGITDESIENICAIIMATKIPQSPKNHIQQIICDADLDYLGRKDFFSTAQKLKKELASYQMIKTDKEWQELQLSFLKTHSYFTSASKKEREPGKQQHLQALLQNNTKKKTRENFDTQSLSMKKKSFWLRTFNVRPDEWWLVKKLFTLQFLQGAGIAFFFTSAYSLFLSKVGITELPYVFIYSAFLLWGTGYVYSVIEHKVSTAKLTVITTVFMVVSIIFFRLMFIAESGDWFLYWMLAWFNVLYLLNNLEFWGIAAVLFDVRQSKRLFGVISAGDIPAKFIGYSLALLTVHYVGTINLLWAGAVCVAGSLPFLRSIIQSEKLGDEGHGHHHTKAKHVKKHKKPQTASKVTVLAKNITGNTLIRRLALLTVIVSTCFIIINYAFYASVKEAFKDDVSLASFIAFFLAFSRIAALAFKSIFTSRLITRLGIVNSLLVTPVAMILLLWTVLIIQNFSPGNKTIIYLFGATAIAVDVLRSAINSPVFLTIMQPLPTHERLRAHTIVKGIMDPFASLITGIILLVVLKYQHGADLTNLYYILLVLGILWIIGIYRTNSEYIKTIIKTISNRYFNREDFDISDAVTAKWIKDKIQSGGETEVINIFRILDKDKKEQYDEVLFLGLQHPSEKVKTEALNLIREKNIHPSKEILLPLLNSNNYKIVAETIKQLHKTGIDEDVILPYLDHSSSDIKNAAVIATLKHGGHSIRNKAEELLTQMTESDNPDEQASAAAICGEVHTELNNKRILHLLHSPEKNVRNSALAAAGKTGNSLILREAVRMLHTDEKEVLQALFTAGDYAAVPLIKSIMENKATTSLQKEKLVLFAGRINGTSAHQFLIELLDSNPELYKPVIKALFRSRYIPVEKEATIFENKALLLLEQCAGILYMQNRLSNQKEQYLVLNNSLNIELADMRDSLLYIFSMLYGREKISEVRKAYSTEKKNHIVNAMEIIEMVVKKDIAGKFNAIFEPANLSDRLTELQNIYTEQFFKNVDQVLIRILSEGKYTYHYWTMACSLYTSKKQHHALDAVLIDKYTTAENVLLRETAEYAR